MHHFNGPAGSGRRRGFTLVETLIVIVLMGIVTAIAIPRVQAGVRSANRQNARSLVATMYAQARTNAIQTNRWVSLVVDGNALLIVAQAPGGGAVDTVGTPQPLDSLYDVTVETTVDTLTVDPRGLGVTPNAVVRLHNSDGTDSLVVDYGRIRR